MFKLLACRATLTNLAYFLCNEKPDLQVPSMQSRPHFAEAWGMGFREMLKLKLPHDYLYLLANEALHSTEFSGHTLELLIYEMDNAFNEIDPANPVKLELDGDFFTSYAWNARGMSWSDTVSADGWSKFSDRLARAQAILEPLYDEHPDELGTCLAMMTVELGQGQGRDRLEKWFQRGIKTHPDDFDLYSSKQWYLQPRWYGSVEDVLAFGQECIKSGNWSTKIPMILPVAMIRVGEHDTSVFARPDIWVPLEKAYRDYLEHYPKAVYFRTNFARQAYAGGYKDVACEQMKILGDDWDITVMTPAEYRAMAADVGAK